MEYGAPLKLGLNGKSTSEFKSKQEWDKLNNEESKANAQALISIFNGVCPNKYRKIANCTYAKEA